MASREKGLSYLTTGDQLPDNIEELVRESFRPEDSGTTPKYVREWCCLWYHKYDSAGKFDMCKEIIKYAIAEGNGAVHESYDTSVPMQEFAKIHVDMVLEQLKIVSKKMTMLIALILPDNPSPRDNIARHYNAVDLQIITEALIANYEKKLGRSNQPPRAQEVSVPKATPAASGGGGRKEGGADKSPPAAQTVPVAMGAKAAAKEKKEDEAATLSSNEKGKDAAADKQALDANAVSALCAGFARQPEPVLRKMLCSIMNSVVDGSLEIEKNQMTKVFNAYMDAREAACLNGKKVSPMIMGDMLNIYNKIEKIDVEDFGDFHDALTGILFVENPSRFADAGQFPLATKRALIVLNKIIVKQATVETAGQAGVAGASGTTVCDQTGGKRISAHRARQDAVKELWDKFREINKLDPKEHEGTINAFFLDGLLNAASSREVSNLWSSFLMFCKSHEKAEDILNLETFMGKVIETFSGLRCHEAKESSLRRMNKDGIRMMVKQWEKAEIDAVFGNPQLLPTLFKDVDVQLGKVYLEDNAPLRRFLEQHVRVYLMTHWTKAPQNVQKARGAGDSQGQAGAKLPTKRKGDFSLGDQADVGGTKKSNYTTPIDPAIVDPLPPPVKPAPALVIKKKVLASKGGEGGANDADKSAAPRIDDARRAVSMIAEQAPKTISTDKAAEKASKTTPAGKAAPVPRVGQAAPALPVAKAAAPAAPAPPAAKAAAPAAPAPPAAKAPAPPPAMPDFRTGWLRAQQLVRGLCKQRDDEVDQD